MASIELYLSLSYFPGFLSRDTGVLNPRITRRRRLPKDLVTPNCVPIMHAEIPLPTLGAVIKPISLCSNTVLLWVFHYGNVRHKNKWKATFKAAGVP